MDKIGLTGSNSMGVIDGVKIRNYCILLCVLLWAGCGSGDDTSSNNALDDAAGTDGTTSTAPSNSTDEPKRDFVGLKAGPFTLEAGQEKFYCYTHTIKEDLVIDQFSFESTPSVHHVVMSKSMEKVEDGFEECDVLFRSSWSPLYITGTGNAPLEAPKGAGYKIKAGTQIVIQLHLLNADVKEVTEEIEVQMRKSLDDNVEPVGIMVFGSMGLAIPPQSESDVVGACTNEKDMKVFAVFPHMHYMGTSMVVEAGSEDDTMKEVYRREPYDFDNQNMDPLVMDINKNDRVKVTCGYNNTTDQLLTFGESSNNEMCFFIAFATGIGNELSTCLGGSYFPEACGTDPANELGLGKKCTKDGGECEGDMQCSDDLPGDLNAGVCIGVNNCKVSADCGTDGVCCGFNVSDFQIDLCLPKSCVIPGCEVK